MVLGQVMRDLVAENGREAILGAGYWQNATVDEDLAAWKNECVCFVWPVVSYTWLQKADLRPLGSIAYVGHR